MTEVNDQQEAANHIQRSTNARIPVQPNRVNHMNQPLCIRTNSFFFSLSSLTTTPISALRAHSAPSSPSSSSSALWCAQANASASTSSRRHWAKATMRRRRRRRGVDDSTLPFRKETMSVVPVSARDVFSLPTLCVFFFRFVSFRPPKAEDKVLELRKVDANKFCADCGDRVRGAQSGACLRLTRSHSGCQLRRHCQGLCWFLLHALRIGSVR